MNFVHDNEILAYQVDLVRNMITFSTDYKNQTIEIVFNGVMAHLFENELPGSIIFDIEEYPVSLFIEQNRILLNERKNQCWPINYKEIDELFSILVRENYAYYMIYSSYGLSGWILAKNVELKKD